MRRFFFLLFLAIVFFLYQNKASFIPLSKPISSLTGAVPTVTPKVYKPVEIYTPPKVKPAKSYTILFVGDSMTSALGENFESLRKYLGSFYPGKEFGLFNYGFGSSNILSLEERLHQTSNYLGKDIPPILGRYYDAIIIESFGYNPLSQFSLEDGLRHQNENLDRVIAQLYESKPESLIILMATIAPSKKNYALGIIDVTQEERTKQAVERIAYIQNHIDYATTHNFPLINVFEKSLDSSGNAISKYISSEDYIHPSPEGVRFISQQIAEYFNQKDILPK